MKAMRYENLVTEIDRVKPRKIMEVGTCKGERAEMMIRAALKHHKEIEYIGFDLFYTPPEGEFSARTQPWSVAEVSARLEPLGANVKLIQGDTRQTLPGCGIEGVDFVFLDGGHSDETVASDFAAVMACIESGTPIMCDDYWNYPGGGGCNKLVDNLDRDRFSVEILDPADVFKKPYGTLRTQIVRVVER
jgi:predicted O-methyltransferase YrrM